MCSDAEEETNGVQQGAMAISYLNVSHDGHGEMNK